MNMELHPDFPVVTGDFSMPNGWSLTLPVEFNRRIEDGSLVLWMPGLTFWINVWNNDAKASPEEQLDNILISANPARRDQQIERGATLLRVTYELAEEDEERPTTDYSSISGHVIAHSGFVQISAYYDTPEARSLGYQVIHSVRHNA